MDTEATAKELRLDILTKTKDETGLREKRLLSP
jgi:hypothetical protein